jgi:hypothetical protein
MARKTAAERQAEADAARLEQHRLMVETYPDVLMKTLENVTSIGGTIAVHGGMYVVELMSDGYYGQQWKLSPATAAIIDFNEIDALHWTIKSVEAAIEEDRRLTQLAQSAVSKLSVEEYNALKRRLSSDIG